MNRRDFIKSLGGALLSIFLPKGHDITEPVATELEQGGSLAPSSMRDVLTANSVQVQIGDGPWQDLEIFGRPVVYQYGRE